MSYNRFIKPEALQELETEAQGRKMDTTTWIKMWWREQFKESTYWDEVEKEEFLQKLTPWGVSFFDALSVLRVAGEHRDSELDKIDLDPPEIKTVTLKSVDDNGIKKEDKYTYAFFHFDFEQMSRSLDIREGEDIKKHQVFYQCQSEENSEKTYLILTDHKTWVAKLMLCFGDYSDDDYDGDLTIKLWLAEGQALDYHINKLIQEATQKTISHFGNWLKSIESDPSFYKKVVDQLLEDPHLKPHFQEKILNLALSSPTETPTVKMKRL